MSARRAVLERDVIGSRPSELVGLPLFAATEPAAPPPVIPPRLTVVSSFDDDDRDGPFSRQSDEQRDETRRRTQRLIQPEVVKLALERKDRAESPGVVADDIMWILTRLGLNGLMGEGQRALSWVGPWLAQLARAGVLTEYRVADQPVRRRSHRPGAHGNLQIVYLSPSDYRAGSTP